MNSIFRFWRYPLISAGVLLSVFFIAALLRFIDTRRAPVFEVLNFDAVTIEIIPLRDNMYVLVGEADNVFASNIFVQIGSDGILLVDTQYDQLGEKILRALRSLTDQPVRLIVNTHMHIDHVGGNEYLSKNFGFSGQTVEPMARPATIFAHENVLTKLMRPRTEGGRRMEIWPTELFSGPSAELTFNGEIVHITHEPAAHTDGDVFVHLTGSKVICAGDVYNSSRLPLIDTLNDGSLDGIIKALDDLATMAEEPGTIIVPGHGPIGDRNDVLEYRHMLVVIRDRVAEMIEAGMSLQQVLAADPTADYSSYIRETRFWTADEFVAVVFDEISRR